MVQAGIKTRYIQANNLNFYIGIAGTGPRLLFITGTNGDLRKTNTPLTSALVENFTVLTYDQRGMGQSDKPDVPYSMLDYAKDAIGILDVLGWDEVMVAGYSFGGMVAQELAIGWPGQVTRLALMATTAGGAGGSSYPLQNFSNLEPYERARRGLEVADLGFTQQWQSDNSDEARSIINERVKTMSMFANEPGAAIGASRQLDARATHDTYDRLGCISAPTLVIGGDRDGQAPIDSQQAMAERIVDCQFIAISGSHGMLWESEQTFTLLNSFFETDKQ